MFVVGIAKWTCTYWLEVEDIIIFQGRRAHESRRDNSFPYIRVGTEDLVNAKMPIEVAHTKTVTGDEDDRTAILFFLRVTSTLTTDKADSTPRAPHSRLYRKNEIYIENMSRCLHEYIKVDHYSTGGEDATSQ